MNLKLNYENRLFRLIYFTRRSTINVTQPTYISIIVSKNYRTTPTANHRQVRRVQQLGKITHRLVAGGTQLAHGQFSLSRA